MGGFALGFSHGEQRLVFVERGVGASETGVACAVDAFGGVVGDEFGGGVVGVEFDLVYCWDDLRVLVSIVFFVYGMI